MVVHRQDRRRRLTLVLLVVTSLVLISLDERGSSLLDSARTAAQDVISPLQGVVDDVVNPVADFFDGLGQADELEAQNSRLRNQNARLRAKVEQGRAAVAENSSLREVFDLPNREDFDGIVAEVITGPVDNFHRTWRIDKGTNAGIEENMAVVVGAGADGALVGVVASVASDSATIRRIDDRDFSAGAQLVQADGTGLLGVVRGIADSRLLSFDLYERGDTGLAIDEDQLVVTAGQEEGSRYPKGLPIGRVISGVAATSAASRGTRIEPVVDLDAVDIVKILRPAQVAAP